MSARDELFRRVAGAFVDEDKANALIDAYAHELAEKIRRQVDEVTVYGDWYSGMYEAADLIDPGM